MDCPGIGDTCTNLKMSEDCHKQSLKQGNRFYTKTKNYNKVYIRNKLRACNTLICLGNLFV